MTSPPINVVVLISGSGSNLQAIIDARQHYPAAFNLGLVLSDRPQARGLQRASDAGLPTRVIDFEKLANRENFECLLIEAIDRSDAKLIILAGFMRILSNNFVNHYLGRLINIHPSLLPKFRGLHTHQRVLDAKCKKHGASVHFVTPDLDAGPVIIQGQIDVLTDDTAAILAARVLKIEHKILPIVLNLYAQDRVKMLQQTITLDNKVLEQPLQYNPDDNSVVDNKLTIVI
ncbi:MAG: phosphoribosylglycinamide formyltransferase [Thiohalomonadales bacterium]